ncbi:MAG: VanZ family protein [Gemmatimonadota bacterium]|nr:VanZ family protein [Gemmatimonadota bacterium]
MRQRSWWGVALTAVAVAFIAWYTLRPSPQDIQKAAQTDFLCLYACGDQALRDTVLNIVLFVPLGFALAWWLPGWAAMLLCIAATGGIEYTQWGWLAGRDASLRDLLTNAIGGGLGLWLAHGWRRLLLPTPAAATRLAASAGSSWVAVVGLTAVAVQPSLPDTTWWGQWAPQLGQFEQWRGTLLDADVNGVTVPNGAAASTGALRRELLSDRAIVTARILTGPPPTETAPIVSSFDGDQREIFVLGQRGNDLVFSIRTGLLAAGLRGPLVRFPGALALPPGEPVTVSGGIADRGWQLQVTTATATQTSDMRWSAGLLWSGFLPFTYVMGPETAPLNALWLGLLLLPAGYWLGHATDRRRALLWLGLIVGLGLGILAPLAGLSASPLLEWLGSLVGGAAGLRAATASRGRGAMAPPEPRITPTSR